VQNERLSEELAAAAGREQELSASLDMFRRAEEASRSTRQDAQIDILQEKVGE